MTVKELIEKLKEMPQNNLVLYSNKTSCWRVKHVSKGINELDGAVILDDYEDD